MTIHRLRREKHPGKCHFLGGSGQGVKSIGSQGGFREGGCGCYGTLTPRPGGCLGFIFEASGLNCKRKSPFCFWWEGVMLPSGCGSSGQWDSAGDTGDDPRAQLSPHRSRSSSAETPRGDTSATLAAQNSAFSPQRPGPGVMKKRRLCPHPFSPLV